MPLLFLRVHRNSAMQFDSTSISFIKLVQNSSKKSILKKLKSRSKDNSEENKKQEPRIYLLLFRIRTNQTPNVIFSTFKTCLGKKLQQSLDSLLLSQKSKSLLAPWLTLTNFFLFFHYYLSYYTWVSWIFISIFLFSLNLNSVSNIFSKILEFWA